MSQLKILCCGDVDGRFSAFFKRLETVHRKSGPFEMALCVGSFFSGAPSDDDSEDRIVWADVTGGRRVPPVPVYILGPNKKSEAQFYSDLNGYEICENVIYLGTHGCLTTKEGMRIAYASGGSGETALTYEQYKAMEAQLKWGDHNYQGVDVLIASEWPYGVSAGVAHRPPDLPGQEIGSKLISKLAMNIKPRYHFAGLQGCHYERQPYRNHKVLNEASKHVTRFIGLAKVGNPEKKKWLYAFNVIPIKQINRSELIAAPPDVTDSPYKEDDFKGVGVEKSSQFFYDMNAPMDGDKKRRNDKSGGDFQNKRPKQAAAPCWFCLSGSEVEKHLVVSIGSHVYLALPKGGLTQEHILILPITHHASLLELPEEVNEEVEKFKNALRKCFRKQGKIMVFFERNYKSFHLQLQAVPLPKECKDTVKSVFLDVGDSQNIELLEIPEHSSLTQMAQPGTPYFYVELPNKERLYHRVKSGFPIHFGREVLASPSLLNKEEAIDWRECKADKEEEARLTKEFRKIFAPFDFTLEDNE